MRYIFAGDRAISVEILDFIISKGYKPLGLFVSGDLKQTHAEELIKLSGLDKEVVFKGKEVNNEETITLVKELKPDYVIGIHFPYIISKELLNVPKVGFLNLHPAYLPYNRGWHTPSWAIIEGTIYGATLHFMSGSLDEGDIIYQEAVTVAKSDTANSLYQKVLEKECEVFKKSFDSLLSLQPSKTPQPKGGTSHKKKDLKEIQEIDLNKEYKAEELLNLLRGLTTDNVKEAAYFVDNNGVKHYVQVDIKTVGLKDYERKTMAVIATYGR